MARRATLFGAAAALVLVSGSAHALRVASPRVSNPPFGAATDPREVVSRVRLDVAKLPDGFVPAPLAVVPKTRGPVADELVPNPQRNHSAADIEKAKKTGGMIQLTVATAKPFDIEVSPRGTGLRFAATEVWMNCGPHAAPVALRWTVFTPSETGGTLAVNEGFTDPKACTVTRERATEVKVARVVETKNGIPVFAAKSPNGLLLIMPPAQVVSADAGGSPIDIHRSVLTRAAMPVTRGGSSTLAVSVDPFRLSQFLEKMGAGKPATLPAKVTVQVDASQAVDEESPTVVVRVASADK